MKNRRIVIVAFMLVAALCLGIGYAETLSDTLEVKGELPAFAVEQQHNIAVQFVTVANETTLDDVTVVSGVTATIGADTNGDANDRFSVSVDNTVFTARGQVLKVYVGVENGSDNEVTVAITGDNDLAMFEVAFAPVVSNTIAAGATNVYVLTITLVDSPADAEAAAATFSFGLTATSGS